MIISANLPVMEVTPVDQIARPLGRRERKKRETRIALHRAALLLFSKKGFQETRIGEIADAADVSESTFFRYFDNKEGVALEGFRLGAEALVEAICRRPLSESPIDACLAVNRSPEVVSIKPKAEDLPGFELLNQTPELASRLNHMTNKVLSQLKADFARRMKLTETSPEVHLRAHIVIAAAISSIDSWLANPIDSDPQDLYNDALMQLKSGL